MNLEQVRKTCLITGSNRGLGRVLAETFARSGYDIIAHSRKETYAFLEFIVSLQEETGVNINPIYFDMLDSVAMSLQIKDLMKNKVPIDVLVNNASVPFSGTLITTPMNQLEEVFGINYFAQIQLMQLISKQMIRRKTGSIINIVSVGGVETNPGYLAYGSSKAALIWATKSIAKELAPFNIRVNAVAPGLLNTRMGFYKSEQELTKALDRTSMKRMGEPEEIAKAVLFLAGSDASYITGHILVADGGRLNA